MNRLHVVHGGLSATVQDLGRSNYQKYGVSTSGAMDVYSHALANLLVGNDVQAATLEIAWHGTAIQFNEPTLIAVTGAELSPTLDELFIPLNRPIVVPASQTIRFGHAQCGCYAYLAVAGGIETPECLGSRSTQVRARLGGYQGRAVIAGDELPIGASTTMGARIHKLLTRGIETPVAENNDVAKRKSNRLRYPHWFVEGLSSEPIDRPRLIRAIRGIHFERLDDASRQRFWESEFSISLAIDRTGYRLDGVALALRDTRDVASLGVARGFVQLPVGGEPIVLMADAATTGGYPVIAHVASVDLGLLAQTQPGRRVRFVEIDVTKAQELMRKSEQYFLRLVKTIQRRMGQS